MSAAGLQLPELPQSLPETADLRGKLQETVLLVEDSEEAMLLVRCALEEYGNGTYRMEWADRLTSGLDRLSKGGVDLVLLDLGLPESSGPTSFARIHEAAPEVPVLVLTGDTREQTESAVAACGVDDYLVKDEVSGSLLLQAIRATLYSNKRWKEHKTEAYKLTQRFCWANDACEALFNLATRLLSANRIASVLACGEAIAAIANQYGKAEGGHADGRAELLLKLEQLATAAATHSHRQLAEKLRLMPLNVDLGLDGLTDSNQILQHILEKHATAGK